MLNFRKAVSFLAVLALGCVAASAQTTLSTTTLSAAVSANAKSVVLASVSAVTVPGVPNGTTLGGPVSPYSNTLLVVDGEVMSVTALNGSTVYVRRGMSGTKSVAHNASSIVYVTRPANLTTVDLSGACTINSALVAPQINPVTSHVFNCMAGVNGGQWGSYQGGFTPVVGAAMATANTFAPTANVTPTTSGTTLIKTITVPAGFVAGETLTIIPGGAYTTDTTGNVGHASTAVVGVAMTFTYDGTKFNPSY